MENFNNYYVFQKFFENSPVIYSLLAYIFFLAFFLWVYSFITLRLSEILPEKFISEIYPLLEKKQFDEALRVCEQYSNISSSIIASGIKARKHGPEIVLKVMEAEGRRSAGSLWHKVNILEEVAKVSPMIGLLGTGLGYFFFYFDSERNFGFIELMRSGFLFAIQTTLFALFTSSLTWLFYHTLKYRVTKLLDLIEKEARTTVEFLRGQETP